MEGLKCEGISKSFGAVRALDDLSFSLSRPGIVGIIGPNGSGKTTLLNVMTGFVPADRGRWFIDGREATGKRPFSIARLGVTRSFQSLRLAQRMPVLDNVLLALSSPKSEGLGAALLGYRSFRREEQLRQMGFEALRLVDLQDMAFNETKELSYGQKKLLSLAVCFASGCQTILLDEPFAGVHPAIGERLIELLKALEGMGRLIVFVEHDLAIVRELSACVIAMEAGRILAMGSPDSVISRNELFNAYVGA